MGRRPCCSKVGLNRGAWTALEDKILTSYIKAHGIGQWRNLPKRAGLNRCGKSCRLRWLNYLRPDIKRGNISHDEEELIIRLHKLLGNRWSLIARRLPGRTDNEIKNYWNTTLGKKATSTPSPPPTGKNTFSAKTSSRSRKQLDQAPPTKVTRPQVVRAHARARAIRLSPVPMNPNLPSINQNPGLQHNETGSTNYSQGLEVPRIHHEENQHDPSGINYDLSFFDFDNGDHHFPTSYDDGEKGSYYVNCLPMEGALMVEDYIVDYGGDGKDEIIKDTLDMDSLAFLLDSDEWP